MSTPKHTPGPWETLTFSNHELQTDFAMVKVGRRVHMVGHSEEDKANARLIAAAPDLLEALQEVSETFNESWREGSTQRRLGDLARAAIAKAGGAA